MKQWKRPPVVLLAAMLVIGVSGVAGAEELSGAEEVSGTGKLEAWGDGPARVRGNGKVEVSGSGALYFRDLNGGATWSIEGRGRRVNLRNGWTAWYGFHGSFQAEGTRIDVALRGSDIALEAEGTGWVLLGGEGYYEVNGSGGEWPGTLLRLRAA